MKGLYTEDFWNWAKSYGLDSDGDAYLGVKNCVDFEKGIWFELGKCMWRKHRNVFQEHLKYIHNYILKPYRVGILGYSECSQEIYELENHLPTPLIKGDIFEAASWKAQDK